MSEYLLFKCQHCHADNIIHPGPLSDADKIIDLLELNEMSTKQISAFIKRCPRTTLYRLNELKEKNIVKEICNGKYDPTKRYTLTESYLNGVIDDKV